VKPVPDPDADARVLETLRTHDEREGAVLDAYRRLAEESGDLGVRYLIELIIEDEERHHHVITEMANRIQAWMQGTDVQSGTPALSPRVDLDLLEATRHLLELEHQDGRELRRLEKELRHTPPPSLLPLLTKLMLYDNEKHIEVLHFIRAYTG
jgi:rubrerythrin